MEQVNFKHLFKNNLLLLNIQARILPSFYLILPTINYGFCCIIRTYPEIYKFLWNDTLNNNISKGSKTEIAIKASIINLIEKNQSQQTVTLK
jgi:hypothetical protein